MKITVNGEPRDLPAGITLTDLVAHLQITGRRLAIERNGEIVPRSVHAQTPLCEGDCIEIVHAIGGG